MLPWPLLQGRCVDGAPTLRIPSCAGECPSPLTSANTRLTEPRETSAPCPLDVNTRNRDTWRDTPRLDTASRLHTRQHERPPAAAPPSVVPITITVTSPPRLGSVVNIKAMRSYAAHPLAP